MKDRAIILLVLSNLLLSAGLGYALFFREPVSAQAQSQRKWSSVTNSNDPERIRSLLSQGYEPFAVDGTYSPTGVFFRK